ncbi:MAG: phosphoadenosine phosphosulfate reductase family protein [Candidatus Gastranaerophilales bacterium]|nr:phosphoadenosine phosphosulfate reductase family protein [Candidatus Gastranaerophilales bacterium]
MKERSNSQKPVSLHGLPSGGGYCYVSFSGGKDSTVLLDLARRIDPNIPAVFIDTGLEYPEVRQFALSQENVVRLKPEMNFRKVIETYGYPMISKEVSQKIYEARQKPDGVVAARFNSDNKHNTEYQGRYNMAKWVWLKDSNIPISHMCCNIMKKKPAHKYEKETGLHPILGTMACESLLRKQKWMKTGCNAFDGKRPTSQPLSFWTEQDILEYIVHYNLSYASVYGDVAKDKNGKWCTTKCDRTGCVFCGFGCHLEKEPNRFQRLKQTHPQLWEYCMKPWDEGGLGMKEVLEYIDVKYE